MAEPEYFNSSLTGQQMEDILTGVRNANGYIYVNAGFVTGKIPFIAGAGAPTTATTGEIGQVYFDTSNKMVYRCDSISGANYVWNLYGTGKTKTVTKLEETETEDENREKINEIIDALVEIGLFKTE